MNQILCEIVANDFKLRDNLTEKIKFCNEMYLFVNVSWIRYYFFQTFSKIKYNFFIMYLHF